MWEESIVASLRRAGVTSALFTDHPHLFETGGENYHTDFTAWDYVRGHEGDQWFTEADPSWMGTPEIAAARPFGWHLERTRGISMGHRGYDLSRTWFRAEEDFPGPRTMAATAEWLERSAASHDRFFVFVDEFDPHEPFDVPERWRDIYWPEPWDDDVLIWPPYAVGPQADGTLSDAEARHIRANYGAKLTMIDHHLGRVLDVMDRNQMWDDTALIVCTDHGHYLGDVRQGVDIWGKPQVPQYEPLGHTPLLVCWPGVPGGTTCDALTTNVDLHATIADVFAVEAAHRTHGRSLAPLVTGDATSIRDWAIGGVFGCWVQVTDGRFKYARAPEGQNFPLSMWSNRWSTMPVHVDGFNPLPPPDRRAWIDFMPGSDIPVLRQPFEPGDMYPMWAGRRSMVGTHALYDIATDPHESENRVGERVERIMVDLLRTALDELDAPTDQYERLGI